MNLQLTDVFHTKILQVIMVDGYIKVVNTFDQISTNFPTIDLRNDDCSSWFYDRWRAIWRKDNGLQSVGEMLD